MSAMLYDGTGNLAQSFADSTFHANPMASPSTYGYDGVLRPEVAGRNVMRSYPT
jgi:hypothetical protein